MIDLLVAAPSILTIIVVVVVTAIVGFIALWAANDESGYMYPLATVFFLGVVYLLWHGGAWMVARFMDTVQSYR